MEFTQEQLEFLKKNELFHGLSTSQLKKISPLLREIHVESGETIIQENEISDDIYLIKEGEVEIIKLDPETGHSHRLGLLSKHGVIGEISMLDHEPRSASVITTKPTTFFVVSMQHIISLPAYMMMMQNISRNLSHRMRTSNEVVIEGLKKELEQTKARVEIGRVIVYTLSLISFYILILQLSKLINFDLVSTTVISTPLIAISAIAVLVMMKQSGYPLSVYGLTLKNWPKNIIEALLYSIPIMLGVVLLKWLLVLLVPSYSGDNIFAFTGSIHSAHSSPEITIFLLIVYMAFVPLQELIVRGALQSSLQELLIGPQKTVLAIAMSNLLFGITHLHISLELALMASVPGLFWGWLYSKQRSLVGVTVSHLLVGIWAFFIVGFTFHT